jgi:hypothetical protein
VTDAADEERELKVTLMRVDLDLRREQIVWETPRDIALVVGTVAAITAGTPGYKLASQPPPTMVVHLDAPPVVQPAKP